MNTLSPFLSINCSCDEALQWAKKQFSRTGLRVVQTFDLHTTRLTLEDCPCPHHGTNACDCQMVVLLVYGSAPEPATLILHGNDGQTWLSLIDRPGQQVNKDVTIAIQQALDVKVRAG
ncbi:MAG: hypothetical protein Q7U34_01465 [Anaerolineales bacterium]|nr:hypothetical protein [Anaerolineales bacterium]